MTSRDFIIQIMETCLDLDAELSACVKFQSGRKMWTEDFHFEIDHIEMDRESMYPDPDFEALEFEGVKV
jgi:hypothetical protein